MANLNNQALKPVQKPVSAVNGDNQQVVYAPVTSLPVVTQPAIVSARAAERNLRLHFAIKNNSENDIRVALLSSYFHRCGTKCVVTEETKSIVTDVVEGKAVREDITFVKSIEVTDQTQVLDYLKRAGYLVDAILDDGEIAPDVEANTVSSSSISTIRDFQSYIKTNEWRVKSMTIASDNVDAYECDMEYAHLTPFKQQALNSFETGCHFSVEQENDGKINISFEDDQFVLNDTLLWIVTIPAKTTVKYTLRF